MSTMPSDSRALVAIDLGAESCRVSLLRWVGGRPAMELVHRFANGAVEREGELRWPIEDILRELLSGLERCASIATEGIRSIAVDGWAVDYVRLDGQGIAIEDPFCYRDLRTVRSEAELHERLDAERMRAITGIQLSRINTAYQVAADREEIRHNRWLHLPEYVLHRLGGRPVAERTNASHSQLLTVEGEWSEEIFAAAGMRLEDAAELVDAGTCVGHLEGELAQLPAYRDTWLIAPACHDTASAIAAIADEGEDWAYISSGTWSLVGALLQTPVHDMASAAANFTNLGAADGKVCFHKGVNGLWLLRQCMETWSREGAELTVPELVLAAERCEKPAYLLDVDDAELLLPGDLGVRFNEQFARRGLAAVDVSAGNAPAIARLIFESLAARYAEVLGMVAELTGRRLTHLYIVGGGSQNQLLNRLTEEATGLTIRGTQTESSTLGNFAVQLATLERMNGDSERERTSFWAGVLAPGGLTR